MVPLIPQCKAKIFETQNKYDSKKAVTMPCADLKGEGGPDSPPPEKSQKYRVS